jgi:hypothetical protein
MRTVVECGESRLGRAAQNPDSARPGCSNVEMHKIMRLFFQPANVFLFLAARNTPSCYPRRWPRKTDLAGVGIGGILLLLRAQLDTVSVCQKLPWGARPPRAQFFAPSRKTS